MLGPSDPVGSNPALSANDVSDNNHYNRGLTKCHIISMVSILNSEGINRKGIKVGETYSVRSEGSK